MSDLEQIEDLALSEAEYVWAVKFHEDVVCLDWIEPIAAWHTFNLQTTCKYVRRRQLDQWNFNVSPRVRRRILLFPFFLQPLVILLDFDFVFRLHYKFIFRKSTLFKIEKYVTVAFSRSAWSWSNSSFAFVNSISGFLPLYCSISFFKSLRNF